MIIILINNKESIFFVLDIINTVVVDTDKKGMNNEKSIPCLF